jgi:hypothetical protein
MRDLRSDSTMQAANRDAMERGKNNPLFTPGDLLWDGVIIREVPEIGVIEDVGASTIDVAANFLCGAQAVGLAYAQRSTPIFDEFDYGNLKGTGVKCIRGVEKLMFQSGVQHGVVTVYSAAVAD